MSLFEDCNIPELYRTLEIKAPVTSVVLHLTLIFGIIPLCLGFFLSFLADSPTSSYWALGALGMIILLCLSFIWWLLLASYKLFVREFKTIVNLPTYCKNEKSIYDFIAKEFAFQVSRKVAYSKDMKRIGFADVESWLYAYEVRLQSDIDFNIHSVDDVKFVSGRAYVGAKLKEANEHG